MRIEEFAPEKAWWTNRKKGRYVWKATLAENKARNYNLDIKNPYVEAADLATPEELLADYQSLQKQIAAMRLALKNELHQSLS